MTPEEFRSRIEALYQAETGAPTAHGAQRWFARECGVDERTVRRWVLGEVEPRGPAVRYLEMREAAVG